MTVPDSPYQVRRVPTQYRASKRIERILEAAAAVMAERGFAATTTAEIAKSASVSIGSVYRYFPDKLAVMRAVVERNNHRYVRRVVDAALHLPPADWPTLVRTGFDIYVDMVRTDDGFRAVSGSGLSNAELEEPGEFDDPLAHTLARRLVDGFGFADTDELRITVLQCVTIGDVLTRLAFRLDVDGHVETLANAKRIIEDLVATRAPA